MAGCVRGVASLGASFGCGLTTRAFFVGSAISGVDVSGDALEVARGKATLFTEVQTSYRVEESVPTQLPEAGFTHTYCVHPICDAAGRAVLLG